MTTRKEINKLGKYKVEFRMCGHWEHKNPEAARIVGLCPIHNYACPICGFGAGSSPECNCEERRY